MHYYDYSPYIINGKHSWFGDCIVVGCHTEPRLYSPLFFTSNKCWKKSKTTFLQLAKRQTTVGDLLWHKGLRWAPLRHILFAGGAAGLLGPSRSIIKKRKQSVSVKSTGPPSSTNMTAVHCYGHLQLIITDTRVFILRSTPPSSTYSNFFFCFPFFRENIQNDWQHGDTETFRR